MEKWHLEFGETRLDISSNLNLRAESLDKLVEAYNQILEYINKCPLFKSSYEPLHVGPDAPHIVALMASASLPAGVGPMAAVAGAIAKEVGSHMLSLGASDVLVDNGGDIFMKTSVPRVVGIYSGDCRISGRVGFEVMPLETPVGICTSSASVGHSISLGRADSVTVVHECPAVADAFATSIGNRVISGENLQNQISSSLNPPPGGGFLVVKDDVLAAKGKLPKIVHL